MLTSIAGSPLIRHLSHNLGEAGTNVLVDSSIDLDASRLLRWTKVLYHGHVKDTRALKDLLEIIADTGRETMLRGKNVGTVRPCKRCSLVCRKGHETPSR